MQHARRNRDASRVVGEGKEQVRLDIMQGGPAHRQTTGNRSDRQVRVTHRWKAKL